MDLAIILHPNDYMELMRHIDRRKWFHEGIWIGVYMAKDATEGQALIRQVPLGLNEFEKIIGEYV